MTPRRQTFGTGYKVQVQEVAGVVQTIQIGVEFDRR